MSNRKYSLEVRILKLASKLSARNLKWFYTSDPFEVFILQYENPHFYEYIQGVIYGPYVKWNKDVELQERKPVKVSGFLQRLEQAQKKKIEDSGSKLASKDLWCPQCKSITVHNGKQSGIATYSMVCSREYAHQYR